MLAKHCVLLAVLPGCLASYVPDGASSWTSLTPRTTMLGVKTDYTTTFGIAIAPVHTGEALAKAGGSAGQLARRDYVSTLIQPVSQIGDGQIQGAYTKTALTTVKETGSSSIVYQTVSVSVTNTVTNTQTATKTASHTASSTASSTTEEQCDVCTTEHTVFTLSATSDSAGSTTAAASCDYTTFTTTVLGKTYIVQSSLDSCSTGDDFTLSSSVSVSSSTLSTFSSSTANATSTLASSSAAATLGAASSCKQNGTLTMTLQKSVLVDSSKRIGSIVANHQFQFDGPTPQAGAILAAGWGISPEGRLVLGNTTIFYQCLSGTFYNLYDENVGSQCSPVYLDVVNLIDC